MFVRREMIERRAVGTIGQPPTDEEIYCAGALVRGDEIEAAVFDVSWDGTLRVYSLRDVHCWGSA